MRRAPSEIGNIISAQPIGLVMLLGMPSLSAGGEPPARRAVDILGIRWVNRPGTPSPLTPHHTYHSASMDCDVGYLAHELRIDVQMRALRYAVDHFTLP